MKNKSKQKFLLLLFTSFLAASCIVSFLVGTGYGFDVFAASSYQITVSPVTDEQTISTSITQNGNKISFSYSQITQVANKWGSLSQDGYLINTSKITGIRSICISFQTVGLGLSVAYGWYEDDFVESGYIGPSNPTFNFNNESPNYFKVINNNESDVVINHIQIVYSCYESELPMKYRKLDFVLSDDEQSYSVKYADNTLKNTIVPSTYNGLPVVSVARNGFLNCSSLKSIELPYSIASLNNQAFRGCSSLSSINLPYSLGLIGEYAFYGCGNLTTLNIPSTVTSIGKSAFSGCSNLKYIVIPHGISELPTYLLSNCRSLICIYIPKTVTYIGDFTFYNCYDLQQVFYEGTKEEWDNVEVISPTIDNVRLSNSPKRYSVDIASFEFKQNDQYYCVIANKEEVFGFCLLDKTIPSFDFSSEFPGYLISSIREYGFSACTQLEHIDIPLGIKIIEKGTFYNTPLRTVSFPSTLTKIRDDAFCNTNLESVVIPDSVTFIGQNTFGGCHYLEHIELSKNLKSIEYNMFNNCSSLSELLIPKSVTYLGGNAFMRCNSLFNIDYEGTIEEWGKINKDDWLNLSSITTIACSDGVITLGA